MKPARWWQRIIILSFLLVSVLAPLILFSSRLQNVVSTGRKEFVEDLNSIKHNSDELKLTAIELETEEGLKEPLSVVYKDGNFSSQISHTSDQMIEFNKTNKVGEDVKLVGKNGANEDKKGVKQTLSASEGKGQFNQTTVRQSQNVRSQSRGPPDAMVMQMKDQLARARAYLRFSPPNSNSRFVKELKQRIKEVERALGEATSDSELSKSARQKMRAMESTLAKASHIYSDCSAVATELRAMTHNSEERVRTQKNQVTYLMQLAGRTTPRGLHCLAMQLTAEYFAQDPEAWNLPNQPRLLDPDLHHFVVISDNILACAVVVNSTISSAVEPQKTVFHVVTNSLNYPAISMWFLQNPPDDAIVQVLSMDNFKWLPVHFSSRLKRLRSRDVRYTSPLNHLRFYLPNIFPALNKVVLLDHDVVVQKDLAGLWALDMKGKVLGAVETCQEGEPSFLGMDMFINFSDPLVAEEFDVKACTWAFGVNVFDLQEWRRKNLTAVYHKYLLLGLERPLWRPGSLPLGWITFYNQTVALDKKWHALGLGYESGVEPESIRRAAVVHYNGLMKPWLDICIKKYRGYWSKFVNYDHPYLQQCNIRQ